MVPGERLINFVWYRNYLAGGDLDDVLTDEAGQRREISVPPGAVARASTSRRCARSPRPGCPRRSPRWSQSVEQPFLQVVYDIEVPRMAFGRVCLLGDAAFVVRPHAAAGTAKAAADAWALADALARDGDVAGGAGPMGDRGSSRSARSCSSARARSAAGRRSTAPGCPAILS